MKLLYLAPANNVHSERWIRWFAAAGHSVHWISAHPKTVRDISEVQPLILPQGKRTLRRWIDWLTIIRQQIKIVGPDVVHVHSLGTYALLAYGVPRGVPVVVTPWGSDLLLDLGTSIRRMIVRRTIKRAVLSTCDAIHMRNRLLELGAEPSRTAVVNFGIDTAGFAPIARARQERSHENGATRLQIISLRNLDSVYDIPTLIRCARRLKDAAVDCTVRIFGSGPERAKLETLVRSLDVSDVVAFCGRYSPADLPRILCDADVYVSTSTSDAGIAASTAEAMAAGLPSVVSDSGENHLWITDGINGRLFPVGNDHALCVCLSELASNIAARQQMGEKGRQTICERNDYHHEMRRMEQLYADVVSARSRRDA